LERITVPAATVDTDQQQDRRVLGLVRVTRPRLIQLFEHTLAVMAFWVTELPGGGFAMGEASDEAEARMMIARHQGRASVTWSVRVMRYRWTVVLDEGKTSHGWADTEDEGW